MKFVKNYKKDCLTGLILLFLLENVLKKAAFSARHIKICSVNTFQKIMKGFEPVFNSKLTLLRYFFEEFLIYIPPVSSSF